MSNSKENTATAKPAAKKTASSAKKTATTKSATPKKAPAPKATKTAAKPATKKTPAAKKAPTAQPEVIEAPTKPTAIATTPAATVANYELVTPSGMNSKKKRSPRLAKDGTTHFTDDVLDQFREKLLLEREKLHAIITVTREDALKHDDGENPEEDGTIAFARNLDLHRADEQNQRLRAIDNALRAIDSKTYGVCQDCKRLIDRKRLAAYPFAVRCVTCKTAHEDLLKKAKRIKS